MKEGERGVALMDPMRRVMGEVGGHLQPRGAARHGGGRGSFNTPGPAPGQRKITPDHPKDIGNTHSFASPSFVGTTDSQTYKSLMI